MRVFYSFLIIVCSTILLLLPVSTGIYDFRTDQQEDSFTITTGISEEEATVQLFDNIYENDTSTISLLSHDVNDSPIFSSYNGTTRALVVAGLSDNTTRTLDVSYDREANNMNGSITGFLDILPWIWILIWVAFPVAALIAIWTGRL